MENKKKITYIIVTIVVVLIVVASYFVWNSTNKPLVPTERPRSDMNIEQETNTERDAETAKETDIETK